MTGAAQKDGSGITLSKLCGAIPAPFQINGDTRVSITGLSDDSRNVRRGHLFAAILGTRTDGHNPAFVRQAISNGAAAILAQRDVVSNNRVPTVRVPDTRIALAQLAARFFGVTQQIQTRKLRLIGITGTNGKSTVCYLVRALMSSAGHKCANIGTIEYHLIGRQAKSALTTPGPIQLAQLISEASRYGADRLCMEVSSHALHQRRTEGLDFAVAVFTNLTGDHHDYHGGPQAYLRAKKRLFDRLDAKAVALINADDPAAESIAADCRARIIRYGLRNNPDLRAEVRNMTAAGTELVVRHDGHTTRLRTRLVGEHNAYNVLAAFGVGLADGIAPHAIARGIETLHSVPGRLERVGPTQCPLDVFVDYAHTDDALRNVLNAARQIRPKQLIVVFGCGGDRDRSKRPRMARVAAELADRIVVTSDNPRTEDPDQIIEEIIAGLDEHHRTASLIEPDRERAISAAIGQAQPGDIVLIAGKGHEDYQIVGEHRRSFQDRDVASRILENRYGGLP